MKSQLIAILSATLMTGCAALNTSPLSTQQNAPALKSKSAVPMPSVERTNALSPLAASLSFKQQYQLRSPNMSAKQQVALLEKLQHHQKPPAKNINYYVRGLMQDLIGNLQYVNQSTPVAVTSFVLLDGALDKTSLLGNQISESLMHEIHKFGIPVLDFKVSEMLNITPEGDFILSRDYTKLSGDIPIRYIVTGTLVKHQGGYLVNARVVGIESKAVVASAQSFIPADVAGALISNTVPSPQAKYLVPLTAG